MSANTAHPGYPPDVMAYLDRLYDESQRELACQARTPQEAAEWQTRARPVLRRLLGLDAMAASLREHEVAAELEDAEDLGVYTRSRGWLATEPNVRIPFWLLEPKGGGPFPLALTPHGHDRRGYDTSVGIAQDEATNRKILDEDRDVAVQAVREGFLTIAPATRGIGCDGVPDIYARHSKQDCRSQAMHCLLAGRTAMGERIWDMERLIDWAVARFDIDERCVLMMGNSGGGMVTTYAAACDTRIQIAVPSCSFGPYARPDGKLTHCDCNIVPGILRLGEFHDVAGLIAPRYQLIVNGRHDPLHDPAHVDQAVADVRRIYSVAGAPDHFAHQYGKAGHRFYKDLMWPFIRKAAEQLAP